MICKHCGFIVPDGALVCPQCGAETDASRRSAPGAAGIRQGRRETPSGERAYSSMPFDNEPPAQDAVVVSRRRPRSQEMEEGQPPAAPGRKKRSARKKRVRRFAVNWALVGIFKFDLVAWIFGGQTAGFSRVVYTIVGLAGLWCIRLLFRRTDEADAKS